MESLNQVLSAWPKARQTPTSSGDAEVDSGFQPVRVWLAGLAEKAAQECDDLLQVLFENGFTVSRVGPRELLVRKPVDIEYYTQFSASF